MRENFTPGQKNPPVEKLHEILICDAERGILTWKHRAPEMFALPKVANSWNLRAAGKRAFTNIQGKRYFIGRIYNKSHKAHRVIWAMATGAWPDGEIDHINGDGFDNRISNLRVVDRAENARNAKLRTDNTSGVVGVYWSKLRSKWYVRVQSDGKDYNLGHYVNKSDAIAVRLSAQRNLGFHQNHGRAA